jgi:hypothetical protein
LGKEAFGFVDFPSGCRPVPGMPSPRAFPFSERKYVCQLRSNCPAAGLGPFFRVKQTIIRAALGHYVAGTIRRDELEALLVEGMA